MEHANPAVRGTRADVFQRQVTQDARILTAGKADVHVVEVLEDVLQPLHGGVVHVYPHFLGLHRGISVVGAVYTCSVSQSKGRGVMLQ